MVLSVIGEDDSKIVASLKSALESTKIGATIPPKLFVQTKILLEHMSKSIDGEKFQWNQVMENFELLFSKVNDIGVIQQESKCRWMLTL